MDNYMVLEESSRWELEKAVNSWIKLGYKPIGTMAIQSVNVDPGFFGTNEIDTTYTQAMLKNGN